MSRPLHILIDEFDRQLRFYYDNHFSDESCYQCALDNCEWPECESESNGFRCSQHVEIPETPEKIALDHPLNLAATELAGALGLERLPSNTRLCPGRNFRKLLVASGALPMELAVRQGFSTELNENAQLAVRNAIYAIRDWLEDMRSRINDDTPIRINLDDVQSLEVVKSVSPLAANSYLKNGVLQFPEDDVRSALQEIFDEAFESRHSPAELNDLITSNLIFQGRRVTTAFMLKGPGVGVSTLEIKHCGKQGNQLLKLFDSPAEIFAVQFVGKISESVVRDAVQKTQTLRLKNQRATLLIIDGQDTARLLLAFNKIR